MKKTSTNNISYTETARETAPVKKIIIFDSEIIQNDNGQLRIKKIIKKNAEINRNTKNGASRVGTKNNLYRPYTTKKPRHYAFFRRKKYTASTKKKALD